MVHVHDLGGGRVIVSEPSSSQFIPKGAFVFIIVFLLVATIAWFGMYVMLVQRGGL